MHRCGKGSKTKINFHMKTGIVGYGYWGKIIESKLDNPLINPETYDDVNFLFVSTPPITHYNIVEKALLEGKNVFCEKPLTLSYELSKELIELSYKQKVDLYIDNIFLQRNEIKDLKIIPKSSIQFYWVKMGPHKDTLINDLLYHDLYILVHLLGEKDITHIEYIDQTEDVLMLEFNYGDIDVYVFYNRNFEGSKNKHIVIDGNLIDLSIPQNDSLKESIDKFLNKQIDLDKNHQISLYTNKLLELFL